MINIRTLRKLENNDGLTLKNGHIVTYKTGYQVATEGVELRSIEEAIKQVRAYKGNCGIWYSEGIWYIDKSVRIAKRETAVMVGKMCHQISILKWSDMSLVYMDE